MIAYQEKSLIDLFTKYFAIVTKVNFDDADFQVRFFFLIKIYIFFGLSKEFRCYLLFKYIKYNSKYKNKNTLVF